MKLTNDQEKALSAIKKWLKAPASEWIFTLAGFAGTGKTTLLQVLIRELQSAARSKPFICCAPTGKAASVLRSKLPGVAVLTAHQVLYVPKETSTKELNELLYKLDSAKANGLPITDLVLKIKEEKDRLSKTDVRFEVKEGTSVTPGSLVIVDEASMISERMRDDFKALSCKVLFVGDSGQLPPVRDSSWFIDYEHDARLNEILRQALDSPIIRLSMQIRNGGINLAEFREGACVITKKSKVERATWSEADQVLTGGNHSRRRLNRFFRKTLGHTSDLPEEGDKMICLKNAHRKNPPWINGVQFVAAGAPYSGEEGELLLPVMYEGFRMNLEYYPYHCAFHYNEQIEEEPREFRRDLFECDYAYGITVHKSQGSEWPFVILADDELQKGNKPFRQRWLYTAVTRAKERFLLIMND